MRLDFSNLKYPKAISLDVVTIIPDHCVPSKFQGSTIFNDIPSNHKNHNVPKIINFNNRLNSHKNQGCEYSPIQKQESFTENLSENSKINNLITTKNYLHSDSQYKNKISNSTSECISKKQPESRSNSKGVKNTTSKKMSKLDKVSSNKTPFIIESNKTSVKFKTLNNTKKLFYETPQTQTQSQQSSNLNNDTYKEFEKKLNMKTRNLANYLVDKRDSKSKLRTLQSQTTQKIANIISNPSDKLKINKKKENIRGGTLIQYMFK